MNEPKNEKFTILFFQLVMLFQSSAMQQLGKLPNSMTGKIELDLDQASTSIDMLDMLLHKCKGNLSSDEARFLEHTVSELKLNYVDEIGRKDSEPKSEEPAESAENNSESSEDIDTAGGTNQAEPQNA